MGLAGLAGLAELESSVLEYQGNTIRDLRDDFSHFGVVFGVWGLTFGTLSRHFEDLGVLRVSKEGT